MNWFEKKRKEVAKSLSSKDVLLLSSASVTLRQPDVTNPYRQDSNFYYLTGFEEPSSLLVLSSNNCALFIPDKDPLRETWDGKLPSKEEVKKTHKFKNVYYISELKKKLPIYLKGKKQVFYDKKLNPCSDKALKPFVKKTKSVQKFLSPFREIKNSTEIAWMKQSIAVSKHAHAEIARQLKPGINERNLHGIFIKSIMEKGSPREAYGSIIACGNNATTLHYIKNNSVCRKGDLLLVDAGSEMNHYASDITRMYPVSGKFSKKQKDIYQALLLLQKSLIKEVKPKVPMKLLNKKMKEGITQILLDMKILKGSLKSHLQKNSFHKYCPHSVGHLLGLDVHDPWFKPRGEIVLKAGMVITIEPGIYIAKTDKNASPELRGLGLRIEDNILVTNKGQTNLSAAIPKEIKQIENLCKKK